MSEEFRIVSLGRQDRTAFYSGVNQLDRYLRDQATQDVRRRISNCFVALDAAETIAGYYTFAAASVSLSKLPPDMTKRPPRYPRVPAALIGRLAVDQGFRRRMLGAALIGDAILRARNAGPAVFALLVDAKDETAAAFYRHHAFRPLVSRPLSLFLTLATAEKAFPGC